MTLSATKVPDGFNAEKTIKNQFKKAIGKGTDKLVISNCANHAGTREMCAAIEDFMFLAVILYFILYRDFTEILEFLYFCEVVSAVRFTR